MIVQFNVSDGSFVKIIARFSRHKANLTDADRLDYTANFPRCPTELVGLGEARVQLLYEVLGIDEKHEVPQYSTGSLVDGLWQVDVLAEPKTAVELNNELVQRQTLARTECRRRILEVVDETAQINLAAAAAADALTADQLAVYKTGLDWIKDMRGAWPNFAVTKADITDDSIWPSVPTGVAELGAAF